VPWSLQKSGHACTFFAVFWHFLTKNDEQLTPFSIRQTSFPKQRFFRKFRKISKISENFRFFRVSDRKHGFPAGNRRFRPETPVFAKFRKISKISRFFHFGYAGNHVRRWNLSMKGGLFLFRLLLFSCCLATFFFMFDGLCPFPVAFSGYVYEVIWPEWPYLD
jgi:hypothetical protein